MKYVSIRMPDPTPLGETFFDASARAMVEALFVNSPSGGCVESVVTFATQRFFFFPAVFFPEDILTVRQAGPMPEQKVRPIKRKYQSAPACTHRTALLMVLEVLHCLLMRLCRSSGAERPQISPLSSLGILLSRVQPVLARFQFSNHMKISANQWSF